MVKRRYSKKNTSTRISTEARKKKGILFIISAPSGCGKTTICKRVLGKTPNLKRSISVTTRKPRSGEKQGKDYHFISERKFKKIAKKGELLEWAKNFGGYYGTPRARVIQNIKHGKDVLLSIDVKGAMRVKKKMPGSILIFITPPSIRELTRRLKHRHTEKSNAVSTRLRTAEREFRYMHKYNYAVLNNRLSDAVEKIISIIKAERCKAKWHICL